MIELSVIIPCHNEAQTLSQQLDALTSQNWDGSWEVVVVDNRSTDHTVDIARSYTDAAVPVRVVHATERAGVAYARNSGVRSSTSRSVAFCDGDDVVCPGWVGAIGDALRTNSFVTGTLDNQLLNEPWLSKTRSPDSTDRLPTFGQTPFARGNNTAMHRELWEELDGYDEDFIGLEDIEFSLRAASAGYQPTLVSNARVAYRFRSGLRSTWRQGTFYGRGRPNLAAQADRLGIGGPGRFDGLKSWAWLVLRSPTLVRKSGRYAWVFTLANRWGVMLGAIESRRVFI